MGFAEILDAAEELTNEEKKEIARILKSRAIAAEREEINQSFIEAEKDLREGRLKPMTAEEMMKEAMS